MANTSTSGGNGTLLYFLNGDAGSGQNKEGIAIKAFALNIAVSLGLFALEISGFFLLKSSAIGRRIYQPKTYLVQDRLRVESVPANPLTWLRRILTIKDEELKTKCGLDGYFFIRLIRALVIIFVPLMVIIVTVLLPINYHGGRDVGVYQIGGRQVASNVTGLDTLSWQNVAPTHTKRYWAHLVCAILAVSWTLYRIYHEKLNFIDVRQRFLTSPEHRLKASARTILITNIPSEYRSKEALEALYDVFVDNDDRSRLTVWVNRDYGSLRALVARRRTLRHHLEKQELRILRLVNKKYRKKGEISAPKKTAEKSPRDSDALDDERFSSAEEDEGKIAMTFEGDCHAVDLPWHQYLKPSNASQVQLTKAKNGHWKPTSSWKIWHRGEKKTVPKIAWLRAEIARLNVQIEELLLNLDSDERFKKQNSAFIQFDRQMAAHMACSLVSHNLPGRMSPRYLEVAPHEIIWPNMDVTSFGRLIRTGIALFLFLAMLFLWGIPTTILASISQLGNLRSSVSWLHWLRPWPSWVISLIAGPLTAILLALLIQLVVPALMRKLAVLTGTPTRSKREVVTQDFYFTFLFIELVLLTAISSGIANIVPSIVKNPTNIPTILANNLPKSANYFFNYLVVQSLGFSGSVLFQYLRILYITTIWPWFTQTPREEAWLQTTIPHQMWANVYSLSTNFAAIGKPTVSRVPELLMAKHGYFGRSPINRVADSYLGFIYCIISPLMLVFVSFTFSLFWLAYRHNYYYVQRNKIDTHGLLFNNALSQLFAGIYVLEIALIGLFFLVRDTQDNVACSSQAIIMIVVLILTAIFHFVMEQHLRPLYEFLPVTVEDSAVDAERERFLTEDTDEVSSDGVGEKVNGEAPEPNANGTLDGSRDHTGDRLQKKTMSATAAQARASLSRLKKRTAARVAEIQSLIPEPIDKSRRREVADQLAAAIAGYPDELTDLSREERAAELKAAFQDPMTREPMPVIWIPQDRAGMSKYAVEAAGKYGKYLHYSDTGAYLTSKNKCEVTQPAPDVRPDWLLDWVL
ncbi:hypothetical protein ACLMJK_007630 [Lecanora helva]